jgi:hypothetical protein
MDAPVLDGLDGVGDFQQLARGFLGICVFGSVAYFIALCPARLSQTSWHL